jgi:hypothetical protein
MIAHRIPSQGNFYGLTSRACFAGVADGTSLLSAIRFGPQLQTRSKEQMRLESAAEGAVTAHFAPPASFFIEGFAVAVDPSKLMREEWGETVIRDSNPLPGVNATSYKPAAPAGR